MEKTTRFAVEEHTIDVEGSSLHVSTWHYWDRNMKRLFGYEIHDPSFPESKRKSERYESRGMAMAGALSAIRMKKYR
ncbi:MAG: hypothetical protein HY513_03515 [Candidatus Aenigmarchaeota archaeon]|nr:hypothetical protein [Candidatus Aenigmarchaeota archaeon]